MLQNLWFSIKDWFLRPVEQRGMRSVLFGPETKKFCIALFVTGIVAGLSLLVMQMCSVDIDTRENITVVLFLLGLTYSLKYVVMAVKALNTVWKKVVYILIVPMLISLVITISQWLIMLVIGGLILSVLFKGFSIGGFFGEKSSDKAKDAFSEGHVTLQKGTFGEEYILGNNGESLTVSRHVDDHTVQTNDGAYFDVSSSGAAKKL